MTTITQTNGEIITITPSDDLLTLTIESSASDLQKKISYLEGSKILNDGEVDYSTLFTAYIDDSNGLSSNRITVHYTGFVPDSGKFSRLIDLEYKHPIEMHIAFLFTLFPYETSERQRITKVMKTLINNNAPKASFIRKLSQKIKRATSHLSREESNDFEEISLSSLSLRRS